MWKGKISPFGISNCDLILAGGEPQQQRIESVSAVVDPLDNFHGVSAVIGYWSLATIPTLQRGSNDIIQFRHQDL